MSFFFNCLMRTLTYDTLFSNFYSSRLNKIRPTACISGNSILFVTWKSIIILTVDTNVRSDNELDLYQKLLHTPLNKVVDELQFACASTADFVYFEWKWRPNDFSLLLTAAHAYIFFINLHLNIQTLCRSTQSCDFCKLVEFNIESAIYLTIE